MKNIIRFSSLLLISISLLFASGCGSSSSDDETNPNSFSAIIDGATYNATSIIGIVSPLVNLIQITTTDGTNIFSLLLPETPVVGTHTIPSGSLEYDLTYIDSNYVGHGAISGAVTIIEYDATSKSVKGTFECSMSDITGENDDLTVTNGKFEAIIQ